MPHPIIVGISGASGSGKTTLAQGLKEHYKKKLLLLSADRYYKHPTEIPANICLDDPIMWDSEQFIHDLKLLKQNITTDVPVLDFHTPLATREKQPFTPKPIIVVDGVLVLLNPRLRDLFDIKVYVKTPSGFCLLRRIERDEQTRGIDYKTTLSRFPEIFGAYKKHTKPGKEFADIVILNDDEFKLESIITAIDQQLTQQGSSTLQAKL